MSYYNIPAIPGWTYQESLKAMFLLVDIYNLDGGGSVKVILSNQFQPDNYYRWTLIFSDCDRHVADREAKKFFSLVEALGYEAWDFLTDRYAYMEKIEVAI